MAEKLAFGYLPSALMFGGVIAAIAARTSSSASTPSCRSGWPTSSPRALGASIGDYLSQSKAEGGLGLGTTGTSALFLVTILALVSFLTVTMRDQTPPDVVAAAG